MNMSDRRHPMYPPNAYPSSQWSGTNEPSNVYQSSSGSGGHYQSSSLYVSPSSNSNGHGHGQGGSAQRGSPQYTSADTQPRTASTYQSTFYAGGSQYSSARSSSPPPQQPSYPLTTAPTSRHHAHSHSSSHPLPSHSPPSAHAHTHTRPRSHSHSHPYLPPPSPVHSSTMGHQMQGSQHQSQVSLTQTVTIPAQFPASPMRPFSCDMCALSFNRAHDLSRHRQTHTGEKPFLCNGGCGKSFTRRDALKRHQLVKQCGKIEEAWP